MSINRLLIPAIILMLIAGGVFAYRGGSDRGAPGALATPGSASGITVTLDEVLVGFTEPVHVTNAGDGTDRMFIVERRGQILVAVDGVVQPEPFLDIQDLVTNWFTEQGLFSIAFHPQFSENGYFYVFYTATPENEDVSQAGDNTIARFTVMADDPNRGDLDSMQVLLALPDREVNHNGGQLLFGADGYLYAGTGDEGGWGWSFGNSQDPSSYFGKILRLDVDGGDPYAVPADNPFVGDSDYLPEIWAMGLRNPWRFSFDPQTGDMFIGDVGELAWEEVNRVPAGESGLNFGWPVLEAHTCFPEDEECDPSPFVPPILTYPHSENDEMHGCSVTGGFVYRGAEYPFLDGIYVFADWCSGRVWGASEVDGVWEQHELGRFWMSISSLGQDEQGELYLTDMINGKIQKLHFHAPLGS